MKILLISGHGAGDVGAQGNGYQEYKLTREFVNILHPRLSNYAEVDVYNQNRNAYYDAQNGKFNIGAYDYVLEIHFNAFNISAYGTEMFVVPNEQYITVEQAIMKRMGKWFTLRDNDNIFDGVKRTRFLVINEVKKKGISGALLEVCFIDNPSDMATYQANKFAIADGIVEGIVEGFGLAPNIVAAPDPVSKEIYRVRKSWTDVSSQVGAYAVLSNAKKKCDEMGSAYKVYNTKGSVVYTPKVVAAPTFKKGGRARLNTNATTYFGVSTGVAIPPSVKGKVYTIADISKDGKYLLLAGINSWVLKSECTAL